MHWREEPIKKENLLANLVSTLIKFLFRKRSRLLNKHFLINLDDNEIAQGEPESQDKVDPEKTEAGDSTAGVKRGSSSKDSSKSV